MGQMKESLVEKEFFFCAAGTTMLFHNALAMLWCPDREGWKQSSCKEMKESAVIFFSLQDQ